MNQTIYVVKGTRYEIEDIDVGGSLVTRVLEYASGDLNQIREKYANSRDYLKISIEPVRVNEYESLRREAA